MIIWKYKLSKASLLQSKNKNMQFVFEVDLLCSFQSTVESGLVV